MQDSRNLFAGVPDKVLRPVLELRECVQHTYENILHQLYQSYHLPHEVQGAFLQHIRLNRRQLPAREGAAASGSGADMHFQLGVGRVAALSELHVLAGGTGLHSPNRDAAKDAGH